MLVSTRYEPTAALREKAAAPCVLVVLGATGDLTKRLLLPAIYNLACDGLLSDSFAIVGMSRSQITTADFRRQQRGDIRKFATRESFDSDKWDWLESRLHYCAGDFGDPASFVRLRQMVAEVDGQLNCSGNTLCYLALPPEQFGPVARRLGEAGFTAGPGWSRLIVEKPFGKDLKSAQALNQELLTAWHEDQIYRIDHYLGKETVQNLLAFRFANSIFEPIWNKNSIDHIQISVMETVGVEGRGGYYDKSGALRDMVQNHILQMLACICMEPPVSFEPNALRDEKCKALQAVETPSAEDVKRDCVRAQYGAGLESDGTARVAYRQEPTVNPASTTETFAALKLNLKSWRWEGVPVYVRSGKSLWKRGTEITVQFKAIPHAMFRGTPSAEAVQPNLLVFHIQPDQAVEFRLQAKHPGALLTLQNVDMRFDYASNFSAHRGTGYEVLIYSAMNGDATLFSRTDFAEAAWRIVQPILDAWAVSDGTELPTYTAGSWGPRAAFDLLARDGRRWHETATASVLSRNSIFGHANPQLLKALSLALQPRFVDGGQTVVKEGDPTQEMYYICRGELEVIDCSGQRIAKLGEGDFFGEIGLLFDQRRNATVRTLGPCDLFILDRADFYRIVKDYPDMEAELRAIAAKRIACQSPQAAAGA